MLKTLRNRLTERAVVDYAYLGEHRAVTITNYGRRIILDTRNVQNYSIITHGTFEPKVAWALGLLAKPESTAIDVGANIGFFTMLLATLVGNHGRVFAFEPNPEIFKILDSNLLINALRKRCFASQVAVADTKRTETLTWETAKHGGGYLLSGKNSKASELVADVRCVRLDDVVDATDVSVVKIDTEGYEPYVLAGAKNLISANLDLKVVAEWNPQFIQGRGYDVSQAVSELRALFQYVYVIEKVEVLAQIEFDDLSDLIHANIVLSRTRVQV